MDERAAVPMEEKLLAEDQDDENESEYEEEDEYEDQQENDKNVIEGDNEECFEEEVICRDGE